MSTLTYQEFESLKEDLEKNQSMILKTLGHSMAPIIVSGDQIHITPIADFASLKRFDLLVYWENGVLMCHYLWGQNKYISSQGLIQLRPLNPIGGFDGPIPKTQVLGKLSQARLPFSMKTKIILLELFNRRT